MQINAVEQARASEARPRAQNPPPRTPPRQARAKTEPEKVRKSRRYGAGF
jgi:hypothetical protein